MLPKIPGIYAIVNLKNGKIYIGQTANFRKRFTAHKSFLRTGSHPNHHLQAAWNKYGEGAFEFKKLEYCSVEDLDKREQHYLNTYLPKGVCYNVSIDASAPRRGLTYIMDEERKVKIGNANRGKKRSDEQRELMRGRIVSDETKEKLRLSHLGKVTSEETKQKMSESNRCIKRPKSDEHRKKISDAHKGQKREPFSEETKQKMSEAAKKRYARQRAAKESVND